MKYYSYDEAGKFANIIVDGYATTKTVLTLSHWPGSNTPVDFLDDTSTAIVFKYLESNKEVSAEAVSNNHFDEDGLAGIFVLLNPDFAVERKELLCDIASTGDFGVYKDLNAFRIVNVIQAYTRKETSPLSSGIFLKSYQVQCSLLYKNLLELLPDFIEKTASYAEFYSSAVEELQETERLIDSGIIKIEEFGDLDLAVVFIPEDIRKIQQTAIHTRTPCTRVIYIHGSKYSFQYRYESWVEFYSRNIPPRVELNDLVKRFNNKHKGHWVFGGIDEITPLLYFKGDNPGMSYSDFIDYIKEELALKNKN